MKKKLLSAVTSDQANLFGKTFEQMRKEEMLKVDIENLRDELMRIDHLRECERCMFEVILSIERYFGRTMPWYLNLNNDISESEGADENCPKPRDYDIGYYGNDCTDGTKQFIKARLVWAEKTIRKDLLDLQKELKEILPIKAW